MTIWCSLLRKVKHDEPQPPLGDRRVAGAVHRRRALAAFRRRPCDVVRVYRQGLATLRRVRPGEDPVRWAGLYRDPAVFVRGNAALSNGEWIIDDGE